MGTHRGVPELRRVTIRDNHRVEIQVSNLRRIIEAPVMQRVTELTLEHVHGGELARMLRVSAGLPLERLVLEMFPMRVELDRTAGVLVIDAKFEASLEWGSEQLVLMLADLPADQLVEVRVVADQLVAAIWEPQFRAALSRQRRLRSFELVAK